MFNKKIGMVLAACLILGLACSLTPQQPTLPVDQGQLETIVAQTLAAAITETQSVNPPATDAPLPTDTPEPPPGETPTETPTNTPEAPSATPTQEPPLPIGVADLNLGSPDWSFDFGQKAYFHTYNSADSKTEITDGKYLFTLHEKLGWSIWAYSTIEIKDYYFEIGVKLPEGCTGVDRAGVIFGTPASSTDEGYLFHITCDGQYRLSLWNGTKSINLINYEESSSIKDPGEWNRIGVWHKGNKIVLYINGIKMDEVTDSTYAGKGKIGLTIGSENTNNFVARFDDAAYWNLP